MAEARSFSANTSLRDPIPMAVGALPENPAEVGWVRNKILFYSNRTLTEKTEAN
jgi:hypothetical protein